MENDNRGPIVFIHKTQAISFDELRKKN